jgi:hypothetical protein
MQATRHDSYLNLFGLLLVFLLDLLNFLLRATETLEFGIQL